MLYTLLSYFAPMLFALAVVVNPHLEQVTMVTSQRLWVGPTVDLLKCNLWTFIYFKLNNDGWLIGHEGDENQIGNALARGDLFEYGVLLNGSEVGQEDGALQGGFVVVGQEGTNA